MGCAGWQDDDISSPNVDVLPTTIIILAISEQEGGFALKDA